MSHIFQDEFELMRLDKNYSETDIPSAIKEVK